MTGTTTDPARNSSKMHKLNRNRSGSSKKGLRIYNGRVTNDKFTVLPEKKSRVGPLLKSKYKCRNLNSEVLRRQNASEFSFLQRERGGKKSLEKDRTYNMVLVK